MEPLEPRYALSGAPSLVADINLLPRSGDPHLSAAAVANSVTLTTATSQVIQVFSAADAQHGVELWTTDGTPGGTRLLKDIWPGTTGSSPTNLASVGGMVYFAARDPVHGRELWKTDGTAAGTVLVKNIDDADASGLGPQDGNPGAFVASPSGGVLFVAEQRDPSTAVITRQLWKTDGTDAGTVPVISLVNAGLALDPQMLTTFGTHVLFSGRNQSGPSLLWITDGTSENTVPVRTSKADVIVNPGTFTVIDGPDVTSPFVIFTADDGFNGRTIWRYDSTNGPGLATSFGVTPGAGSITEMVRYGTTAVFAGDNGDGGGPRLWRTNAAEGGTHEFRIYASPSFLPVTNPAHLTVAGTKLFFTADGLPGETSLWVSDGTDFGTVRLGSSLSGVESLVAGGSDVLFVNFDGQSRELWKSDGTSLGIIREINPGPGHAFPAGPVDAVTFGDELLFAADDGVHGTELWKTDGSAAGTQLVRDINTATADGVVPTGFTASFHATAVEGDTVWFVADDGTHGAELWKRSGVAAPVMVADITPGPASSALSRFTVSGGKLFFTAAAGTIGTIGTGTSLGGLPSLALWVSDGTAAGTFKLTDQVRGSLTTSPGSSATRSIAPFAGGVIFAAADTTHGTEPWFSDGTATGTKLLADLADTGATAGSNGDSSPEWFVPLGGEVFFVAADGAGDRQIWKTDGTAAGTVRVTSLPQPVAPTGLAAFGGNVVFAWASSPGDVEPWITDTTSGQMRKVADINPAGSSNPTGFVEVGGRLFFTADDGVHGDEPWVTDGVTDTRLLMDINPGSGGSAAGAGSNGLVPVSGVGRGTPGVVFTADAGTGPSLWTSDGTPEGTAMLPLPEGVGSGSPGNVLGAGGMLYFTAELGGQRVLFESDGTAVGGRVVELSPGVAGSRAVALAATSGALLFSVDDGFVGSELWQLPIVVPPPDTVAPTVEISSSVSQLQPGGQATITFTVSEAGTGFTEATVKVTGGTLTGFTGNGTTYTASFTAGLSATSASIFVPVGAFTDGAGNPNVEATLLIPVTGPADTTPPTVAITASTSQLLLGQTATIAFTLSEPAAVFSPAVIRTVGGTLSGFSGAGTAYIAVFTPQPGYLGAGEVSVAAGAFADVAGNVNRQPAAVGFVIDTQPPTASGATALPAGFHKAGAVLAFDLFTSEPVTVLGTPRIPILVGAAWRQAVYVGSPDGGRLRFAYTVQPGDNTPLGDRTGPRVAGAIDLAGGSIRDQLGNDFLLPLPAVNAADVVVDTTPPTVAVTSSRSLLGAGKTSVITFTLSEPSPDFGRGCVTTTGGTLSGFTGSGTTYTAWFTPQPNLTGTAVVQVDVGRFADRAGNADTVAARRAIAVDTALRFAAGTDGQSAVWDREFAYRAASATVILLPLPASQAAFFAPRSTLSITPNGATRSIVATVNASGYDAATGSVVVTLDRNVPVTKTAGFGTLVLGGIVPPGARLLAGVSGAVVHDYAAADLLRAGYSAAFVTRFQGGLRTAAADLDDNGFADLIVAPGGVPNLPDPLAPGRRLADAFGSSLRTVAIFDGSPQPAWAPVRLDVGPVLGAATRGGFQVATGNIVADASGSATLELIVASGTRLAVYEVRVAAAAARPVIDPVPIRVVELGAGRTATGVAAGRLFMDDPYDDIVVAATTASGRVAGTTTVTVLAGAALDVVRSFPVSSRVEAGPNRLLTDIFGFGASLAVGDIDGNGRNDLVLGAGAGGLGNFRVLANEVVTANPVQPAFSAAITTQLGAGGTFAQYRPPTRAWRPTGGPDYFTPGAVTGPTGQGFNAPVSVRVVNVSTTGSARAEIFAALGATNQTANTVKRFLFTGPGRWTSAAAFDLLPSSATDSRFRRGAGVRLG